MTWLIRSRAWLKRCHQRIQPHMPPWGGASTLQSGIAEGQPRRRAYAQRAAISADGRQVEDDTLLQLIAEGHQSALHMLYDRHSRRVFSLALYITGEPQDAEAVTEDVFVLVWHHHRIGQSRPGTVQDWMAAITRTRALATLRLRHGTACHHAVSAPTEGRVVHDARDLLEAQAALRATVCRAFDTVPTDQRQVLERIYYGGRTIPEVAADLAVPIGTVQARVRRALLTLRTSLKHAADTRGAHDDHAGAAERAVGECAAPCAEQPPAPPRG